jgi:hypothetical protein
MLSKYAVFEVSAEFLMDIAKEVTSSPHPLDKSILLDSFDKNHTYTSSAIAQCLQLGLFIERNGEYLPADKYRDLIKRSDRTQLHLVLRQALQSYQPCLLYLDFLSKGYPSDQSARMTAGIFRIQSPKERVEKMFRNWGLQTGLITSDSSGKLSIPEGEKGLPNEYMESLMKALRADLQAKIFLIETMSPSAYKYLDESDIEIDDLSDALVNYENDPKTSANKATQVFEHFLFKFGEDIGANITKGNGIIEYANIIQAERSSDFLVKHKHLCYGIGGLRLMAHHDPDKETSNPWIFTPQGAIISTLIVPATLRSIYLYWTEKKQEF